MNFEIAIEKAKEKLGKEIFDGLNIVFEETEDKFFLSVKKKGNDVTIKFGQRSSLFRALTILKEKRSQKDLDVVWTKHFATNGYMIDCSRNGVVKLDQLKAYILTLALMGENRLLLYTEDTYQLEKYPYFGYLRGGYSKEDVKEIVAYGECFGVELVPCIQTLGHLHSVLRWEKMIPLRDGPSTLLADEEKVYEFIEEMIKFSRECFKSKDIHIGMDESTEMGLGRYLEKHPYKDRVELFSEHIKRVIDICGKYDFEPMIWSDMFFRLNSENEEYYRDTPLPKSTLKLIPEGIKLVYWDYYHCEKEVYDRMFSYHQQAKNPIIFAGGAWRWKGFAPSIQGSFRNTIPAIESSLEHKIKDFFITAWGDNGNECSIYTTLPILALASVADFIGTYDEEAIDSLLKAVIEEPLKRMFLMDAPDMPDGKVLIPQYNPSKMFLYQDVMNGLFDWHVKPHFAKQYAEYAKALLKASEESEQLGYAYKTLSLLCDVLSIKVDLGTRIRKAYKANDKAELKAIVDRDVEPLMEKLDALNEAHRCQWNKENKQFGFDVIDGRMGFLKNRILTARKQVYDYVEGKVERLEELETEIRPYNDHEYEVCWNQWVTTVTVNCL
ncbi:MAG: beta-N-acetylhexosaminidase [Bacilli bacterium]|nr:beta-N-acetylhexosaminidase [Bacilli bacterium]